MDLDALARETAEAARRSEAHSVEYVRAALDRAVAAERERCAKATAGIITDLSRAVIERDIDASMVRAYDAGVDSERERMRAPLQRIIDKCEQYQNGPIEAPEAHAAFDAILRDALDTATREQEPTP